MSESTGTSHETDSSKGSSRLKKLTSSSTWTSPFRNPSGKKNIIKEFKDNNSVSQLHVPKKFTSHPNLDKGAKPVETTAEKPAESTEKPAESTEKKVVAADPTVDGLPDAALDVKTVEAGEKEPVEEPITSSDSERPLTAAEQAESGAEGDESAAVEELAAETPLPTENAAIEATEEDVPVVNENVGDDNIEQQVKETPIELDLAPEDKYVPVDAPNQKVLDSFADKPNLLNRYQELNGAVVSNNPTSLDGPDKVIDLGSGLRLTQQQLLDIAAKRVAPVIANINEEVEKTQQEDKIVEKKELDATVAKHDAKLGKDFDKHVAKVEKARAKFDKEIAAKLSSLEKESAASTKAAEEFERKTREEIATANENYIERERKAMEQHEVDKDTLIKNHDELEATKKQELADAKTGEVTTTEEIENLQETKSGLDNTNSELSDEIERLTKELAEREEALTAIEGKLTTEKDLFSKNETTKKELNEKVVVAQKGVEEKKESKSKLATEVGLLGTAVAAYAAKLASLKSDNAQKPERLSVAKEKYNSWAEEKRVMAEKAAREHEQQRIEAREAAATEKIKAEIEEEKQRLEEEKQRYAEERERLEKEEQERKEQREKEEQERIAAEEQAKKEAEEKAAQEAEEKRLAEEKAAKEKQAEEKRLAEEKAAKERKEAEEKAAIEKKEAEEKAAREKRAAEEKALKEKKEAEELKLAEEKAAKEGRLAGEKTAQQKKLADEEKAREQDVNTIHRSADPETTVVGYSLSEADGKKSNDNKFVDDPAAAPISAHKKEAPVAAVPVSKTTATEPKSTEEEGSEKKDHKTLAALGAGAGAGAVVGTGAAVAGDKDSNPERKHSLSKKLKSVFGRKSKDEETKGLEKTNSNASKGVATGVKPVDVAHQPYGKAGAVSKDSLISIYEEVSDHEYEQHKNDPDYIEVDAAEAAKLLKRHKELLPNLVKQT
ncbi:hypothetical protein OXX69_008021 [Metschnikowia pulcherrima]